MAKDLENLVFTIDIEGGQQARSILEKIADSFNKVGDEAQKADKQTQQVSAAMLSFASFAGTLAANAVSMLTRELFQLGTAFASSVIAEASEGEQSTNALTAAIVNAGMEVETTTKKLNDFTDSLMETTTFSDDAIMAAETLAIRLGWTTDEIEKYFQTAADLAVSKGATLSDSVLALNKSLSGNAAQLQRLYPELKDFTEEQLKAGAAIAFVQEKMGGAAYAMASTYAGRLEQLTHAWDNLKQVLGDPIIKNLTPFLMSMTQAISEFTKTEDFKNFANDIGYSIGVAAAWIEEFMLFLAGKPNAFTGLFGLDREGTFFDRILNSIRAGSQALTELFMELATDPKVIDGILSAGVQLGGHLAIGILRGLANFLVVRPIQGIIEGAQRLGVAAEYVGSTLTGGPMSYSYPEYAKARGVASFQDSVSPKSGASTTINQNIQVHSVTNGDDLVRQLNTAAATMKPLE